MLISRVCDIICTSTSLRRGISEVLASVADALSLDGVCLFMGGKTYPSPETLDSAPFREAVERGAEGYWVFPVFHGREVLGHLVVKGGKITSQDEILLKVVAKQLDHFSANLRSKRELKMGSRLLLELYTAGKEMGSILEMEEMGDKLAHFARRFSGASCVRATIFDPKGHRSYEAGEEKGVVQFYGEGYKRWVVPLESPKGSWGVLELFLPKGKRLSRYQRRVVYILAELAGTFLENVVLYGRLRGLVDERERQIRYLSILYQVGNAYRMTVELRKRAFLALRALTDPMKGLGLPQAFLFLYRSSSGHLEGLIGISWLGVSPWGEGDWGVDDEYFKRVGSSPAFRDLSNLKLPDALCKELEKGEAVQLSVAEYGLPICERGFSHIALPLLREETLVGALLVGREGGFDSEEIRFLTMFSHQLALALESGRLHETLKKTSEDLEDAQERLFHYEKLATLGELAARVAHDLKNPLVAIGGFARRLHNKMAEDCPDKIYTRTILKEVEEAEKILSDVLGYSKVPHLLKRPTDINALLDDVLFLHAEELRDRGIIVIKKLDRKLPPVSIDAAQMRQVFMNLVSNAIQAIEKKGSITVSTSLVEDRGKRKAKVEVSDTGGGIHEGDLPNIFNPFFTTKSTGTGLGLSIVKRIVELHGGVVEVVNNPPVGATFLILLPLEGEGAPKKEDTKG